MERTKYDGKLTDALIQTVVEAENRMNGLVDSTSQREGLQKPSLTGTLESVTHEDKTAPSLLRDTVNPKG